MPDSAQSSRGTGQELEAVLADLPLGRLFMCVLTQSNLLAAAAAAAAAASDKIYKFSAG